MLRWLGASLILCAGLLARQTLLGARRGMQRTRRELADALEAMEAEIRALLTPLPTLLRRKRGSAADAFFAAAAAGLEHGEMPAEAWRGAARVLTLPEEERQMLAAAGERLDGTEDGVCASLALAASSLRRAYRQNEEKRAEQERLTTSICVCISLFLAVLLL